MDFTGIDDDESKAERTELLRDLAAFTRHSSTGPELQRVLYAESILQNALGSVLYVDQWIVDPEGDIELDLRLAPGEELLRFQLFARRRSGVWTLQIASVEERITESGRACHVNLDAAVRLVDAGRDLLERAAEWELLGRFVNHVLWMMLEKCKERAPKAPAEPGTSNRTSN